MPPYNKHAVPRERTLRQVWKAASDNPRASIDEIARQVRPAYHSYIGSASKSTVIRALDELQRRGVLKRELYKSRSIVVIEPFSWFDGD